MNTTGTEMYYQSHMSAGQGPSPQTVTSPYTHQHQHPHSQPPLLQPGPSQYATTHYAPQYGYANGLASPAGPSPVSSQMSSAPQPVLPLPGVNQSPVGQQGYTFDTTGQLAPVGVKPRVTATLWEDEGSLCFQVEAKGICVARREDNHMINGTKLLNVAGMTRGRRDGILKSEKVRHVVKIGPMHLKGVWIPFERALDFANKEKITELLYPLFVHNIGALLCHTTAPGRNSIVTQRKQDPLRPTHPGPGLPQPHPHLALPGPQNHLPSHAAPMGRPSLDRAHSFPTPPASGVMGGMGGSDSYPFSQQGMGNGQGPSQISIETTLGNNGRSMPNTPATTPPGAQVQGMSNYPAVSQPYDNSRHLYQPAAAPPSTYAAPNSAAQERPMYQHNGYVKSEMAPPSTRSAGTNGEQVDAKPTNGILHAGQGETATGGEEEADHEHDGEYTHDSGAYEASRSSYNYTAPPVTSLQSDSHLPPDMSGSPHQAGSGRATPRTAPAPQPYYAPQGYSSSPRVGQTSSNLYNVVSNERGAANGTSNGDVYASQGDMGSSMQNGYSTQPSAMNGVPSLKRGRDDDDDRSDLKRHKTGLDGVGSIPSPSFNPQMGQTATVVGQRRR